MGSMWRRFAIYALGGVACAGLSVGPARAAGRNGNGGAARRVQASAKPGSASEAALASAVRVYKEADQARLSGDSKTALEGYGIALKRLSPLAKQGNAEAEYYLGKMYQSGQGVLKDPAEARKLFREAANQGNAGAQFFMGAPSLLRHRNVSRGMMWMKLSAEQGNQDAQLLLGQTYLRGIPGKVKTNYIQADMWLRLAARNNLPFYKLQLKSAEAGMNPLIIARAKALAAAWKPKHGLKPPAGHVS